MLHNINSEFLDYSPIILYEIIYAMRKMVVCYQKSYFWSFRSQNLKEKDLQGILFFGLGGPGELEEIYVRSKEKL